jgi:DNA adenine methylase
LREPILAPVENFPFLKWAGGKRWLVQAYASLFPREFGRYFEPFLGSGAIFFYLRPAQASLSDTNQDLISTYRALQSNWEEVVRQLEHHDQLHKKKYYYQIRKRQFRGLYQRAAQLIYLNRTCWNGLYRVNLKGRFNVPIGTKTDVLLASDDFEDIADALSNAVFRCEDFEAAIERAKKNDFVFADPPYTVKHDNNNFVKYNETLFSWDDQIRLSECLMRAKRRGVKVMLTNANHDSVRKLFRELGPAMVVERKSSIAADSERRKPCKELVFRSW